MIEIFLNIKLTLNVLRGDNTVNILFFLAVKIEKLFTVTVALFGAGNRTLKQDFFERPGKNLQISYSFDYVKCAWIMSSWVCT